MKTQHPRYEEDYYGWIQSTVALLKGRKMDNIDMDHLIEEIESMGRSERHQLVSRLTVLLAHLLKWEYQSDFRGRSWKLTIKEQRCRVKRLLRENPSLVSKLEESFCDAYEDARFEAMKESGLDEHIFPPACSYTFEECMNDDFFPGEE